MLEFANAMQYVDMQIQQVSYTQCVNYFAMLKYCSLLHTHQNQRVL